MTSVPTRRYLIMGVLLLASAVLQIQASLQRWVTARRGLAPGDISIEDHRYDYDLPGVSWEPIGSAAQVYGAGLILLAAGILVLGRVIRGRRWLKVFSIVAIAVPFMLLGVHAVIAGLTGHVTSIGDAGGLLLIINVLGFVGLAVLLGDHTTTTPMEAWVGVFLFGSSLAGYFVASFLIAPVLNGDTSYDTTPWTETVIGAMTAAAGITALLATRSSSARREGGLDVGEPSSVRTPEL